MKCILIISFIHFHYNFGEDGDYSNMKLKTYEKDLVNKKNQPVYILFSEHLLFPLHVSYHCLIIIKCFAT